MWEVFAKLRVTSVLVNHWLEKITHRKSKHMAAILVYMTDYLNRFLNLRLGRAMHRSHCLKRGLLRFSVGGSRSRGAWHTGV